MSKKKMHLSEKQLTALLASLNSDRVHEIGGNSYIKGHEIRAALIRVFGFGGWSEESLSNEILMAKEVPQSRDKTKTNQYIVARATVRLTLPCPDGCGYTAVYTESACATGQQPEWGESADQAVKSAETYALRRCATNLGTQFGLSLYWSDRRRNYVHFADVVQVVLAPGQKEIVDARNAKIAEESHEEVQGALDRATGVRLPEDTGPDGEQPSTDESPDDESQDTEAGA
jgi:recombination DNA repair RAD52 pathway protein